MDPSVIRSKDLVQFWVDSSGWMGTSSQDEPLPESSERVSHLRLLRSTSESMGDFSRCTFRIETEYSQKNEITFGSTVKIVHVPSELTIVGRRVVDDQFRQETEATDTVSSLKQLVVIGGDDVAHKWVALPRYKPRQEGEPVRVRDHVILRNAQYKDLAITSFVQQSGDEDSLPSFVGMSVMQN
eukprot:gene7418-9506_t